MNEFYFISRLYINTVLQLWISYSSSFTAEKSGKVPSEPLPLPIMQLQAMRSHIWPFPQAVSIYLPCFSRSFFTYHYILTSRERESFLLFSLFTLHDFMYLQLISCFLTRLFPLKEKRKRNPGYCSVSFIREPLQLFNHVNFSVGSPPPLFYIFLTSNTCFQWWLKWGSISVYSPIFTYPGLGPI